MERSDEEMKEILVSPTEIPMFFARRSGRGSRSMRYWRVQVTFEGAV